MTGSTTPIAPSPRIPTKARRPVISAEAEKLPPFHDRAEAGALGCVLLAAEAEASDHALELLRDLTGLHFFDLRHREIFLALDDLGKAGRRLDCVTLVETLTQRGQLEKCGGIDYVASLPDQASLYSFSTYHDLVCDFAIRRSVIGDAGALITLAGDMSVPAAQVGDAADRFLRSHSEGRRNSWSELLRDGATILSEEIPDPVEIVSGILTENSKLIIGSGSKCFKTWLTMDLALSIAHGQPFLGRSTIRSRVLYVNFELKGRTFDRRIQVVASAKDIHPDPGWFFGLSLRGQLVGRKLHDIVSELIRIAKAKEIHVIVLDPCYKLGVEGDENSSRDITILFNEIDRLTTESGCSVVLNDHAGKGNHGDKDPLDVLRGSSAKGGDLDTAMILRKHREANCFRVDLVHRELAPQPPFVIAWNFPLMTLRKDLSPDEVARGAKGRAREHDPLQLLRHIQDRRLENPVSVSEWSRISNIKRQTLCDYLPIMRNKGWIASVGDGKNARSYVTNCGLQALADV